MADKINLIKETKNSSTFSEMRNYHHYTLFIFRLVSSLWRLLSQHFECTTL